MIKYALIISVISTLIQLNSVSAQGTTDNGVEWLPMEEAQQKAKAEDKYVLVFGYADWCTYCLKMRKEVYTDSSFQNILNRYFYPMQLNVDSDAKLVFNGSIIQEKELAEHLNITSLPTHLFMDGDGNIIGSQPGYLSSDIFKPLLEYVGTGASRNMKFEEFLNSSE